MQSIPAIRLVGLMWYCHLLGGFGLEDSLAPWQMSRILSMRTNFSPRLRIFDVYLCRIIEYNIHEFVEALRNISSARCSSTSEFDESKKNGMELETASCRYHSLFANITPISIQSWSKVEGGKTHYDSSLDSHLDIVVKPYDDRLLLYQTNS